jgi:hypothetical protein
MRWQIINWFIKHYDYKKYLEIGAATGKNLALIDCDYKVDIEPKMKCRHDTKSKRHVMTSDEYFKCLCDETFDIIFIDGYHSYEQSKRDLMNSLEHLNLGGIIIMHDCSPMNEEKEKITKSGDVWKTIYDARKNLKEQVTALVIDADEGCGIVQTLRKFEKGTLTNNFKYPYKKIPFTTLNTNRREYIGTIQWIDFVNILQLGEGLFAENLESISKEKL